MSILVYRLETSKVAQMQFSGTLPNSPNLLMKSVVSFMCDGSFSAKGLRHNWPSRIVGFMNLWKHMKYWGSLICCL